MIAPYIDLELSGETAMEAKQGAHCAVRLVLGDSLRTGRCNIFFDSLETAEKAIAILQVETQRQRSEQRAAMAMREAERAAA